MASVGVHVLVMRECGLVGCRAAEILHRRFGALRPVLQRLENNNSPGFRPAESVDRVKPVLVEARGPRAGNLSDGRQGREVRLVGCPGGRLAENDEHRAVSFEIQGYRGAACFDGELRQITLAAIQRIPQFGLAAGLTEAHHDLFRVVVAVSAPIPPKVPAGGFFPEVEYVEHGPTPKAIRWKEDANARPLLTIIGRFRGHEILDLTFPVTAGPEAAPGQPFDAKVLAFRMDTTATAPMLPFFIIRGDQARWYEQVFTSDKADPFLLEVSRTIPGNGVMWGNFTFGFAESGASIKEVNSGGRKQPTTVTKFRKAGAIESTEKIEEN